MSEERRAFHFDGGTVWLSLTELMGRLDGCLTKHVLGVWEEGERPDVSGIGEAKKLVIAFLLGAQFSIGSREIDSAPFSETVNRALEGAGLGFMEVSHLDVEAVAETLAPLLVETKE